MADAGRNRAEHRHVRRRFAGQSPDARCYDSRRRQVPGDAVQQQVPRRQYRRRQYRSVDERVLAAELGRDDARDLLLLVGHGWTAAAIVPLDSMTAPPSSAQTMASLPR